MRAAGPLNNSPTEDDGQNAFPTRTRRARGRGRGGNGNANRGNTPGVLLPTALLRTAWKEYRDGMTKDGNYIPGWKKGDNWTRYLIHTPSVFGTVVSSVGVFSIARWQQAFVSCRVVSCLENPEFFQISRQARAVTSGIVVQSSLENDERKENGFSRSRRHTLEQ